MAQQTTKSLQCQGNRQQPNSRSIKFFSSRKQEPESKVIKNGKGKGHIPGWEEKRQEHKEFALRGWRVVGSNDKRRDTLEYNT